jgi:hypothetical protein
MDKLKILIGLVYTQLMFCDEHGKLQFHRVMTDTDRPWISIKEILRMVKQALCMDKPIGYNRLIKSVHIDIQYWGVHFGFILQTLREEMKRYLSEGCELTIQTIKDYEEGERAEKKLEDWEVRIWKLSPLEAMDHNELDSNMIQVLWDQKEWDVPLIYTECSIPKCIYEPYEPFKERIMDSTLLIEDRMPILLIDRGQSVGKKENNLRGSPNVSHFYIRWEEGTHSQPDVNGLFFCRTWADYVLFWLKLGNARFYLSVHRQCRDQPTSPLSSITLISCLKTG